MPGSSGENAKFDRIQKELYSSVISDILDDMGLRNHTLNNLIRPVRTDMVVVGRAKTIEFSRVYEMPEEPFKTTIEALDSLKPGEVPLILTNNDSTSAVWGELLSTASRARGARGTVIEGLSRDTKAILEMNYPVFCTGVSPADSKGRSDIVRYDHKVECGTATVAPGDILFADLDGIVAIPREVEQEALKRAAEKVRKENGVRDDLAKGKLLSEAWKKHRVL